MKTKLTTTLSIWLIFLFFPGSTGANALEWRKPFSEELEQTVLDFSKHLQRTGKSVLYETNHAMLLQLPNRGFILIPKMPVNKIAVQNLKFDKSRYLVSRVQTTVYSGQDDNQDGIIDKTYGSYETEEEVAKQHYPKEYVFQVARHNKWGEKEMQALLLQVLKSAQADTFLFADHKGRLSLIPWQGINAVHPSQIRTLNGRHGQLEIAPYRLPLSWEQLYTLKINHSASEAELQKIIQAIDAQGAQDANGETSRIHFLRSWGFYKLGRITEQKGATSNAWYLKGLTEAIEARRQLQALPAREREVVKPKLEDIAAFCLKKHSQEIVAKWNADGETRISGKKSNPQAFDSLTGAEKRLGHLEVALASMNAHLLSLNRARKLNMTASHAFSDIALAGGTQDLLRAVRECSTLKSSVKEEIGRLRQQLRKAKDPFDLFGNPQALNF